MEKEEEFFLDEEGYYVTKELFRSKGDKLEKCPQCGNYLDFVYAEKYLEFEDGIMVIMDIKIYGSECDSCKCGFIDIK